MRLALATGLASALLALAPAVAGADPSPPYCPSKTDPNHCLVRGGGGDVDVSPKLVTKGDVLTVKLSSTNDYGGISDRSSQPTFSSVYDSGTPPVLQWLGCKGGALGTDPSPPPYYTSVYMKGPRTCRYKVTQAGRGWAKATWHFTLRYGALASYSEDFFKSSSKDVQGIEGFVRGRPRSAGAAKGPGAIGIQVIASNKTGSYSAKTDRNGYYFIKVAKPGTFKVVPEHRKSDLQQNPIPPFTPEQRSVVVPQDDVKEANFKLERGDSLKVTFNEGGHQITQVDANGASRVDALVRLTDLNDVGVANEPLSMVVNDNRASLSPRAALCTEPSTGDPFRVWPGSSADRIHVGQDPINTNANGNIKLALYPGTEGGGFTVTVEKKNPAPGDRLKSAVLQFGTPTGGDLQSEMGIALSSDSSSPTASHNNAAQDPNAANKQNVAWLGGAITQGQLKGWTFVPIYAGPKYGLVFYRLGSAPVADANGAPSTGQVFNEGGGAGLEPISTKGDQAFEPLGTWANGETVRVAPLHDGVSLAYMGWPLESGPAWACLPYGY